MGAIPLQALRVPDRQSGAFPKFDPSPSISPSVLLAAAKKSCMERNYGIAESKLTELLREDNSVSEAIALLIKIYVKTNRFAEARELFEDSRAFGYADRSVYTAFIVSCSCNWNRHEAYNIEGYDILDEAKKAGCISSEAFAAQISYYGTMAQLFLAESVFEKADGYRDADVYAAFIYACCKCGDSWKAERALDRAQNEGALNPQMFKNLLKHYSDFQRTDDARRIFDWADARNMVDSELCELMVRCYLYTPGQNKTGNARNVFDFAHERGLATHYMCSLMETGYADSKMPEKAEEIFHAAQRLGIADEDLASPVIRSYKSAGKRKHAKEFFSQNLHSLVANNNMNPISPPEMAYP